MKTSKTTWINGKQVCRGHMSLHAVRAYCARRGMPLESATCQVASARGSYTFDILPKTRKV
jgi:hypothetical protein